MLVVIDIGNTNITIGIYHGDKLIGNYRLTTKMKRTSDEYGFMVMNFLNASKVQPADIKDVIVSSVVPKIMHSFLNGIRKYMHKEPILVGPGIKTGISVKAENPKAVGADRIVDAAGAYYEYGGPCLVVDYGTATPSIMWMRMEISNTVLSLWELKPEHRQCGHRRPSFRKLKSKNPQAFWRRQQQQACRPDWFTAISDKVNTLSRNSKRHWALT